MSSDYAWRVFKVDFSFASDGCWNGRGEGTIKEENVSPLSTSEWEDFRNCNFDNGAKADLEWQPAHFDGLYGVVPETPETRRVSLGIPMCSFLS